MSPCKWAWAGRGQRRQQYRRARLAARRRVRGLVLWQQNPQRAWVEAFPEGRSFVRRLATKYPYVCPLLGSDLTAIIRQGNLALAQAHYRGGNFQEAADLYTKLMQDSAPTLPLLRGLGLSLARLQRYDQAFKHLRAALELDDAKDPFTAGYLALCGAMGKPTNPDDKPKNVTWAHSPDHPLSS